MLLVLVVSVLAGINYGSLLACRPFVGAQFFYREGAWSLYVALLGVCWLYSVHQNLLVSVLLVLLMVVGIWYGYQQKHDHLQRVRSRKRMLQSDPPVIRKTVHLAD